MYTTNVCVLLLSPKMNLRICDEILNHGKLYGRRNQCDILAHQQKQDYEFYITLRFFWWLPLAGFFSIQKYFKQRVCSLIHNTLKAFKTIEQYPIDV